MSMAAPIACLRAGSLTMRFDAGDLRYVKLGGREVIRRIYAAVRDRNWGTVPAEISELKTQMAEDHFRITYTSTHRHREIHFEWQAVIVGETDGSIHFTLDGEAMTTFLRNRIGFCVLHPIRECAGAKCHARYTNATEKELAFPDTIAAEQPVNGLSDLAGLAHEIEPGIWAEMKFEGDVFEMEDQRNWIDASFKTFCTPLRLPRPVEIKAGTRVRQEIRLKFADRRLEIGDSLKPADRSSISNQQSSSNNLPSSLVTISQQDEIQRLPSIGLGVSTESGVPDEIALTRLQLLKLAHLRIDVRPSDAETSVRLTEQSSDAEVLGHKLELAVHLDDLGGWASVDAYLDALASQLRVGQTPLARILIFGLGKPHGTSPEALRLARKHLGSFGVPIGAGTNADLYQLNLSRPPADADFICWSMNPQVHAFDNASIAETPEAAAHQVASVRRYFPGKPLVISPETLRPRFNPNATGPEPVLPTGELPPQVDPRQLSLFGATWTLAMIKALAEAGADSVTFYETIGWRGVMETAAGSPLPETFPSIPSAVFPLYHVLADVGEFAGGEVITSHSSDSLRVESLALRHDGRRTMLLANLTDDPQRVRVGSFAAAVDIRRLDETNAQQAMMDPEHYRSGTRETHGASNDTLELTLPPFALARLDARD